MEGDRFYPHPVDQRRISLHGESRTLAAEFSAGVSGGDSELPHVACDGGPGCLYAFLMNQECDPGGPRSGSFALIAIIL